MITVGYIKLHRSILDWEWYSDATTSRVFFHLLLTANIKDSRWQGYDIPKGSRVCTYPQLANELKISERNARTAISHLKSTGELTVKKTPKFSIISIVNWDVYQSDRQPKRQSSDSQVTVNRQHNKNKRIKEESLNTPKRVFKDGEKETEVSQYADRNDAWD
jgi:hypothetical protein